MKAASLDAAGAPGVPARSWRLLWLALGVLGLVAAFMLMRLTGNLDYVLRRRGLMLATIVLVAVSSAVATVLFQTLSHNRILTPSVMGFEPLFIMLQTTMVFVGGGQAWLAWPALQRFGLESLLMVGFAVALYRWLLARRQGDLHRLLLVGLVFGILFGSLSSLMQRLLLPSEFNILQGRLFARLALPDNGLLALCAVLLAALLVAVWRRRHALDTLALGRELALSLGLDYTRELTRLLVMVALLVAIPTALIGPLAFLGFVAATLAYQFCRGSRHGEVLPAAALIAVACLLGAQLLLEHGLGMAGAVTLVIEFFGGLLFLWTLLRRGRL